MLHRLANLNDVAALIFGTTMTISGPVLADAAQPLPGALELRWEGTQWTTIRATATT